MRLLLVALLWLTCTTVSAQLISRDFRDVSLSDALKCIQEQATSYELVFIYDELEDFRVTTHVQQKSVPDAIAQIVGFYPVRIVMGGEREIYIECTHKTKRHLKGNIIDEHGSPVAYANIALLNPADSTVLCGGVSNESGVFVIPFSPSAVIARISHIGYKTLHRLCDKEDVGTIKMQPEPQRLKGITVEGQMPILRHEAGIIIFDTRHIVGAIDATDLLRYTPGVMVADEAISLFGTSGVILRIDGRELRLSGRELLQMLKSYPAADVERIEIIQNPGARHSAEGNAGVIDIVLKKRGNDYVGGSAGYALTQYVEHGDEANAALVYNRGKVSTSLNMVGIWDKNRYIESSDIRFTDILRHGVDNNRTAKENYTFKWQMDYCFSDQLNVGTYVMYAYGERRLATDGSYDFLPKKPFSRGGYNTQTDRQEDTRTWAVNVNATQTAGRAKIDYNLNYYRMRMDDVRHSVSNNTLIGHSLNDIHYSDTTDFDYKNHIAQDVDNYSAKVDVGYAGLRLGSQYAYTHSHRDLDYSGVGSNSHVTSTYDERIWAAYMEYGRTFGKSWTVNVGGRYEHTWTKVGNQPMAYGKHSGYGRLFPSLHVVYNPSQSHSFNGTLSSHITRPNIINLNPHEVWKDVNHMSFGNQDLKPSYLYKAMMNYAYKGMLGFCLYYVWQKDRIDAVYIVNQTKTYNSWNNITDEHLLGINSHCHFNKLRWMTATLVQGVRYSKTVRPQKGTTQGSANHEVESVSYTGTLQATLFFDRNRKWTANLNATYCSPEKDVAKTLNARYAVDASVQYRFWKDRLTVGLACRNLLASHIKGTEHLGTTAMDFDNKFDYRQIRLSLTYNWGARLRQHQRRYESDDMQERIVNDF